MFDSGVLIESVPTLGSSVSGQRTAFTGVAYQKTLKSAINCTGIALHSGAKVSMTLRPADENSGIVFRRTDIIGGGAVIPALWNNVTDTRLNTCITGPNGASVHTIEHLMAALAGAGVDNAIIDINGPEVPVMDGSAAPFLFLIECAGLEIQSVPRQAIKILKRVVVEDGDKKAMLVPAHDFALRVEIDFPVAAIRRQECRLAMTGSAFKAEVSRARTFGFEQDVSAMRAAGLGRGGSLDNAVVISCEGDAVLNEGGLRYEDEFVRHKTLDAVGDLALAGLPFLGHFHGIRCGHALNNRLLQSLFATPKAWTLVDFPSEDAPLSASFAAPRRMALSASA